MFLYVCDATQIYANGFKAKWVIKVSCRETIGFSAGNILHKSPSSRPNLTRPLIHCKNPTLPARLTAHPLFSLHLPPSTFSSSPPLTGDNQIPVCNLTYRATCRVFQPAKWPIGLFFQVFVGFYLFLLDAKRISSHFDTPSKADGNISPDGASEYRQGQRPCKQLATNKWSPDGATEDDWCSPSSSAAPSGLVGGGNTMYRGSTPACILPPRRGLLVAEIQYTGVPPLPVFCRPVGATYPRCV